MLALGQWRPRHLLGAWTAYWAGVVLVTLGPAMAAMWKVVVPQGQHGSVNAGFGDSGLTLTIINSGTTIWYGSTRLGTAALWLAGPPLLLWLSWMRTRPRRPEEQGSVGRELPSPAAGEGAALREPTPGPFRAERDRVAPHDQRDGGA
jgi:hypothetical protein